MNLLTSALFTCVHHGASKDFSLPQLFAAWGAGEPVELQGLKAHQRPAVEVALAQFGALALEHASCVGLQHSADDWSRMLQDLADSEGATHFWSLTCSDLTQAAFMQPALTSAGRLKKTTSNILDLDTLVTSKNHDLKSDGHSLPTPAHWIYALITLQTTAGYPGPTLYGISRMNGGWGTRIFYAGYTDDTQGGRWREDAARLLPHWKRLAAEGVFGYTPQGIRLLAAPAWDGEQGVALTALHPGYVEVCRIVRLEGNAEQGFVVRHGGTKCARIEGADALNGSVGDPWTPVVHLEVRPPKGSKAPPTQEIKALSAGASGLGWSTFLSLLFDADVYKPSAMAKPLTPGLPTTMRLSALSRGKGETNGYKDLTFTLPAKVVRTLFGAAPASTERQKLLQLQAEAATVAGRVIKRAEYAYLRAHAKDGPTNDELKSLRGSNLHKKNLATIQAELTEFWQAHLLGWLCTSVERDLAPLVALEMWYEVLAAESKGMLNRILVPNRGSSRSTLLRLAKAFEIIPFNLSALP